MDSLSVQTFRDFEVIAVDDGSTDGSGRLLDDYVANFPLVKLHQDNQGAAVARNVALAEVTGDYVLMVDADDVLHPRALEMAVASAEANRADFVVFDYRHVTENEVEDVLSGWRADVTAVPALPVSDDPLQWFVRGRRLPGLWQFLFSRASIEGRRFIPGIMFEDNPFIYSYLAGAPRGVHLDRELYCYVKTDGSVMRRTSLVGKIRSIESVMRELEASVSRQQFRMLVREEYVSWIKGFWRQAYGHDPELASARPEFESFLARLMKDRLIRLGDCPLKWFLRFWFVALFHGQIERSVSK